MITYKKLKDGTFGVIGPVAELTVGTVTVHKKDGTTKAENVVKVTKAFTSYDGSGQVCIGFLAPRQQHSGGAGRSRPGARYECEECGDYITPGTQCWETGMMH